LNALALLPGFLDRAIKSAEPYNERFSMNRIIPIVISVLLAASAAPAQDWAKARLDNSPRHGEWVKIEHDGRKVESYITYPEVKDKAPAVIVIHEIFGLTDWARGVTDQLAEAGYIAIAPDLVSGTAPNGGGTADLGGNDRVGKAISSLPLDQITADLNAEVDYVSKLPSCNGKVVVMGFCWGGGQAFRYATDNLKLKAAMVFYGQGPREVDIPKINCPVYGFYGEMDNRITASTANTAAQMKAAGKVYEPVVYSGAGHGYMRAGEAPPPAAPASDASDADKSNYEKAKKAYTANKKARDDSWKRVRELLEKI
jgi:carboxymethylenebutenolidase